MPLLTYSQVLCGMATGSGIPSWIYTGFLLYGHAIRLCTSPIKVGETLTEMLTLDVKAEEGAIKMYKEIMQVAEKEGDVATKEMFDEIEAEEEEHHDFFTSLLEK